MDIPSDWWLLAIGFLGQVFFSCVFFGNGLFPKESKKRYSSEFLVLQFAGSFFCLFTPCYAKIWCLQWGNPRAQSFMFAICISSIAKKCGSILDRSE